MFVYLIRMDAVLSNFVAVVNYFFVLFVVCHQRRSIFDSCLIFSFSFLPLNVWLQITINTMQCDGVLQCKCTFQRVNSSGHLFVQIRSLIFH
jgi:hypothetical protein